MKTLASVYDLDTINYYAQINFTGFETLIDQIGGVTVNSEQAFSSSMDSYKLSLIHISEPTRRS